MRDFKDDLFLTIRRVASLSSLLIALFVLITPYFNKLLCNWRRSTFEIRSKLFGN